MLELRITVVARTKFGPEKQEMVMGMETTSKTKLPDAVPPPNGCTGTSLALGLAML